MITGYVFGLGNECTSDAKLIQIAHVEMLPPTHRSPLIAAPDPNHQRANIAAKQPSVLGAVPATCISCHSGLCHVILLTIPKHVNSSGGTRELCLRRLQFHSLKVLRPKLQSETRIGILCPGFAAIVHLMACASCKGHTFASCRCECRGLVTSPKTEVHTGQCTQHTFKPTVLLTEAFLRHPHPQTRKATNLQS